MSNRVSHELWGAALVILTAVAASPAFAATLGHVDSFPGPGTSGWSGGTLTSNPGSGGVGGAGDGYLLMSQTFAGNFGARTVDANYQGDWIAAGITKVTFYLNDVGADQAFEVHFLISDAPLGTTWQYNVGFSPPEGVWQPFEVDLTDAAQWTRTRGTSSFETVLRSVERVTIRHDVAPYLDTPDPIAGDLGVDEITLTAAPTCSAPSMDTDADGDVDLADFSSFLACFNGPSRAWSPPPADQAICECVDADDDADVDLSDFGVFLSCFNGPNRPPAC